MKICHSQSKNVKQLKTIIQTLSKNIPNSEFDEDEEFLNEFNKINSNIKALELLNKRLMDLVPREREISYMSSDDVQYVDINDLVLTKSRSITLVLQSLYMDWSKEFDSTGIEYQDRLAFIPFGSLDFKTNKTKVNTYNGEFNNSLFLGNIDTNKTLCYTELKGYLPCNIYTDNKRTSGLLYFYEDELYLYCDNWEWLGNEDTIIHVKFVGSLKYLSNECYTLE